MRDLTIYPMSSYKTKILGLVVTAIALILLVVVKLHGPFTFLAKPAPDRQFNILFVATVAGLYMTAFSKEKNDDERVRLIRAKSLQMVFMMSTGIILAISLNSAISGKEQLPDINSMFLCGLAGVALGIYLVLFHIGLYFDPAYNYNDDTVILNIRKNKRFFIIYTVLGTIFFVLLILLTRKA